MSAEETEEAPAGESNNKNNFKAMNEEQKKALRTALGLAADAEIPENWHEQLALLKKEDHSNLTSQVETLGKDSTKLKEVEPKVETLTKEKAELEKQKAELEKEKAELVKKATETEPLAKAGEAYLAAKRTECERLYKLTVKEPAEAVLNLIKNAKPEELDGLLAQYTAGSTENFSGKCKSCGSAEFEFRSSYQTDENDGNKGGNSDNEAFRANFLDAL